MNLIILGFFIGIVFAMGITVAAQAFGERQARKEWLP